ncbi:MAG: CoA ester lyase [Nocardioides sp.]
MTEIERGPVWLFVPGTRPDRFEKALATGADQVVVDLEDAVAPAVKGEARAEVVRWLSSGDAVAWVRVNAPATPRQAEDLAALRACSGLRGVVVPKVERPGDVQRVRDALGPETAIVALVETAAGIEALPQVVGAPGLERLALGSVDLALDLDCGPDSPVLRVAEARLVLASRAAGLEAPLAGVSTGLRDAEAVRADAVAARRDGFGGKLALHPLHVAVIRDAFSPTAADVEWARTVLAADDGTGVATVRGELVDAPVTMRARRILAQTSVDDGRRTAR